MKKGDYDHAISDFDELLRVNPQFDKAIRRRAEAIKAKESPPGRRQGRSKRLHSLRTPMDKPRTAWRRALDIRVTGPLALLRDNREKGQALLAATNLSQTDRTQLETGMSTLNESIASNETKRKAWESHLKVLIDYMPKNGLFGNSTLIASMSGQASKDQQAVQTAYRTCLRGCAPNNASCKVSCNNTAESSDANKRMSRCAEIVAQFK